MITFSEKAKQLVCSLTGSSIILSSCGSYPITAEDPHVTFSPENFAKDKDNASLPFHLKSYLSKGEMKLINALKTLSLDIYNNPRLASEFDSDPQTVCKRYGISGMEIDRLSTEIQIIRALADKDIVDALEQRNLKKYLSLLKEHGLLQEKQLRLLHKTSEQFQEKMRSIDPDDDIPDDDGNDPDNGLVFGAFAVVFLYVVAATIAAVEVAGYVHFAVKVKFGGADTNKDDSPQQKPPYRKPQRPHAPDSARSIAALNLYLDKTGSIASMNERIQQVLNESGELSPSEIKQLIKITNKLQLE